MACAARSDPVARRTTRGVDIAAKAQIRAILRNFADRGGGVLLSSSDLSELTTLCDAVLVMRHGEIVSRIEREDGLDGERLHADFVQPVHDAPAADSKDIRAR